MLNIGVGNGELTKAIGSYFNELTVVDSNIDSLANITANHWLNNKIIKIHFNLEFIDGQKYDLILLSQVLYYFNDQQKIRLIHKLSEQLTNSGKLVIVYNKGLNRTRLVQNFGNNIHNYNNFENFIKQSFNNYQYFDSVQIMQTKSKSAIANLAGLCLNDADCLARDEQLFYYLELHHRNNFGYYIDMQHLIIAIGNNYE